MSIITHIIEANEIARACLKNDLKYSLKEARIINSANERMLYFYFDNPFAIDLFERNKESIKNDLRCEYKKKSNFINALISYFTIFAQKTLMSLNQEQQKKNKYFKGV
ncbi:hypothetical protein OJO94_02650 [Campylobacter lari]|uniref:hypothetical protein n=1 Tax=Campylobacter lari TaxID=201 RepID=UPI0021F6F942|nr:hypothetical protein [Campylobacter lari]MCW0183992.1 hypothetical protein [Campylobacter lari]